MSTHTEDRNNNSLSSIIRDINKADDDSKQLNNAPDEIEVVLTPVELITEEEVKNLAISIINRSKALGMSEVSAPPIPSNEFQRLQKVRCYAIDEADSEPLTNIVKMVSSACETPMALISIVDFEKQWFKARVGLPAPETNREVSFCAHAINTPDQMFIVEDATEDERFKNNPLVTGDPDIRFYAGVPLVSPDGYALGTLCAIDTKPKKISEPQKEILTLLAKQVMTELNLRYYVSQLKKSVATSENLLCNIFPKSIVPRAKAGDIIADEVQCASVLFADLKGFTAFCSKVSARQVVSHLSQIFYKFDSLCSEYDVCKIKTIGDSYMAAAGVPETSHISEHGSNIINFAREMLKVLAKYNKQNGTSFQIRIGIAAGPVIAGVVGSTRFQYDLWGATVNLASRIESTGIPDEICIDKTLYNALKDAPSRNFDFKYRGEIEMKGLVPQPVHLICDVGDICDSTTMIVQEDSVQNGAPCSGRALSITSTSGSDLIANTESLLTEEEMKQVDALLSANDSDEKPDSCSLLASPANSEQQEAKVQKLSYLHQVSSM